MRAAIDTSVSDERSSAGGFSEVVLVGMLVLTKLATNVGPEFLGHIAHHIQSDVGAPDVHTVAESSLVLWMVGVRNSSRDRGAQNLGVIELSFATIAPRDKDPAYGILCSVPYPAASELEIARVLVQDRREHGGRHKRSNSSVGKQRDITLSVTLQTLPIRRVAVSSLPHQREPSNERNRHRIRHCFRSKLEFALRREAIELVQVFDEHVVRQDPEEPLVFWGQLRFDRRGRHGSASEVATFLGAVFERKLTIHFRAGWVRAVRTI
jgi:hypothetical protein